MAAPGAGQCLSPQIEFCSTIEADPIGAVFDGEHAAAVTVPAAKDKLENPKQRVHRFGSRRRSQHPLASSQARRERTLARARAMEQSAAP
jgi:hypothetical protein